MLNRNLKRIKRTEEEVKVNGHTYIKGYAGNLQVKLKEASLL